MDSYKNNDLQNNDNNSFMNTLKSMNPFSKSKSNLKSSPETTLSDLNNSLNKTIKNESNKPVSSIMEKMSSIKPSESMKESLGKVSSISKKSLQTISNNISTESGFSFIKILIYVIIGILLLAFIGFNVFSYLAEGTDIFTSITAPVVDFVANITGNTAKTTISNTVTGSKNIVDNLEKGSIGSIDYVQKNIKDTAEKRSKKDIVSTENDDNLTDKNNKNDANVEPEPIRTNSLNQGYCYIGKINDTRYCAKVSGRDQCMSGDIYPSMDICVNPNLRT